MWNPNTDFTGRILIHFISSLFVGFLILGSSVHAQDAASSPQESLGFNADFSSTTILRDRGEIVQEGRIYALGSRIRLEPKGEEGADGYKEAQIYDFDRLKMYRVFPGDRIYFESDLTKNSRLKAMQDGWIPWEDDPQIQRRKIRLKEDMINDYSCILYLQERRREISTGRKSTTILTEYSLVWEAHDLKSFPVRIIYFPTSRRIVIVDYKNVVHQKLETSLFRPPEGFLNLNPF